MEGRKKLSNERKKPERPSYGFPAEPGVAFTDLSDAERHNWFKQLESRWRARLKMQGQYQNMNKG